MWLSTSPLSNYPSDVYVIVYECKSLEGKYRLFFRGGVVYKLELVGWKLYAVGVGSTYYLHYYH